MDAEENFLRRFKICPSFNDVECGDGWMKLIHRLSYAISAHIGLIGLDVTVIQVKEKFDTLRFYVDDGMRKFLTRRRCAREVGNDL